MKTIVVYALAVTSLLMLSAAVTQADETVVMACIQTFSAQTPVVVASCDKSAGVPVACPVGVIFDPSVEGGTPCAQVLASFLSLPGYKLVNVLPGPFSGPVYTIVGPSRNHPN